MSTEAVDPNLITAEAACALLKISMRSMRELTARNPPWVLRVNGRTVRIDRDGMLAAMRGAPSTRKNARRCGDSDA